MILEGARCPNYLNLLGFVYIKRRRNFLAFEKITPALLENKSIITGNREHTVKIIAVGDWI